jgi:hypothetical protein
VKNKEYERGSQLKVKVRILLNGDNSWTVAVGQIKFGIVEGRGQTYKFYFTHYFV